MKKNFIVLFLCFITLSCSTINHNNLIKRDYYPRDYWRESTPEEMGLKRSNIKAIEEISKRKSLELHSLTIIKSGYKVYEESFYGYDPEDLHDIASVTKSVISLLVGIAIDRNYIDSVNDSVSKYIPELVNLKSVTIHELLSMSSGIDGDLYSLILSDQWLRYLETIKVDKKLKGKFNYSNLSYQILGFILIRSTGYSVEEFAKKYLFKPVGIVNFSWDKNIEGYNHCWGDLKLSQFDLSKIGYLVSSKGYWNDTYIISEDWITNSLTPKVSGGINPIFRYDYGYGWFIPKGIKSNYFAAHGRGGQSIYLFPHSDSIVITTGNFDLNDLIFRIPGSVKTYPAVRGSIPDFEGTWDIESNNLGFKEIIVRKADNERYQFKVVSGLISIDLFLKSNGSTYITGDNDRIISSFYVDKDGGINIDINQIESINSFKVTLKLIDRDLIEVKLYEMNLIPREITLRGKRRSG